MKKKRNKGRKDDDVVNFQAKVELIRLELLVISTNTFVRFMKTLRLSQAES